MFSTQDFLFRAEGGPGREWRLMAMQAIGRRHLLAGGVAVLAARRPAFSAEARPIRIGEVNSAGPQPSFVEPYRRGWILAQEQLNAAGGVLGRPLETIFRDDTGDPRRTEAAAKELVEKERVALLAGGLLPEPSLALARAAAALRRPCLITGSASDALVGQGGNSRGGNPWTYRLRPGLHFTCGALAREAVALEGRRWSIVAPKDSDGEAAADRFREVLMAERSGVTFLEPLFFERGRLDAGATVQALLASRAEAMLTLGFGNDLLNFVRQGNTRALFERMRVASLLAGAPEYLEPLGHEAPEGWVVTGYPWATLENPAHVRFRDAYRARWNAAPRLGSVLGYDAVTAIAGAITAAARGGALPQPRALADGFSELRFQTVLGTGEVLMRADRQSTLGVFVGRTALRQGVGEMVDWRHIDAKDQLPS
jgi:branched-chain amino acid transport system substrate-binding protein